MATAERRVMGMDGWKGGWVAVTLRNGAFLCAGVYATAADATGSAEGLSVVGIDIPIGFPNGDVRTADVLARKRIGARRSSVFHVPPRDVITAATYAEANQLSKDRHGRGLSKQSYALQDKILEVDAIAREDQRIFEVHPEVTFAALSLQPLHSKKTWAGMTERRELLGSVGIELPADLVRPGLRRSMTCSMRRPSPGQPIESPAELPKRFRRNRSSMALDAWQSGCRPGRFRDKDRVRRRGG